MEITICSHRRRYWLWPKYVSKWSMRSPLQHLWIHSIKYTDNRTGRTNTIMLLISPTFPSLHACTYKHTRVHDNELTVNITYCGATIKHHRYQGNVMFIMFTEPTEMRRPAYTMMHAWLRHQSPMLKITIGLLREKLLRLHLCHLHGNPREYNIKDMYWGKFRKHMKLPCQQIS